MGPSGVECLCGCNICNVWFAEGGLHHISDNVWSLVWHTERSQKFWVPQISRCSLGLPAHIPDTSPPTVGPEFRTGDCAATVSSPVGKWQLPWLACKIFPHNNLCHTRCSLISLEVTLLIKKFSDSMEFCGSFLCLQRSKLDPILNHVRVYLSDNVSLRLVSLSPCSHLSVQKISCGFYIPYILESNPYSGFGDFLNRKKLVCDSNSHLSFNRPLPTGQLIE